MASAERLILDIPVYHLPAPRQPETPERGGAFRANARPGTLP